LAGARSGLLCPLGQDFLTQLADFLDGALLRLVGSASLRHCLIDHVGDSQKTLAQARMIGQALIQTLFLWI
jgi:hypothetical protein